MFSRFASKNTARGCALAAVGGLFSWSLTGTTADAWGLSRSQFHGGQQDQLLSVQVIFRHGHRSPVIWMPDQTRADLLQSFPKCPNEVTGRNSRGCMPGQLTEIGRQQLTDQGSFLREQYVKTGFLDTLTSSDVKAYSTRVPRTMLSCISLLTGLFPEELNEMAHHHKYQYVDLSKSGYMSPSAFICGALREQYHLFHKEPEILEQKAHPELAKAHAKLNAIAQEKGGKVLSWVYIKDNIKCYKGGNTALPAYFDEHVVSTVMKHTPFVMQNLVHSDTSVTLGIGRLVHDILDVCEQHGPESKKLTLYSGHDTTLMPLLVALKFEDKYTKGFVPHYGDMIRVELRDNGKLQYVKLFYNDKLEREVSLEDFTQETAAFRLRSKQMWLQQCALTTHYDKPEDVPQFGYA